MFALRTPGGRLFGFGPGGLPVVYRGVKLDLGYRMDLLVEDLVIVKIKSVDAVAPVHHAQIISYLKLSGKSIGLLIQL
ncbi:MAG: GxxExxY protein [Terriglobales bacterium]